MLEESTFIIDNLSITCSIKARQTSRSAGDSMVVLASTLCVLSAGSTVRVRLHGSRDVIYRS